MDNNLDANRHNEDEYTILAPQEDGSALLCDILETFQFDDVSYIALAVHRDEIDEDDEDDEDDGYVLDDILFYSYTEGADGEKILEPIESEEKLGEVMDVFYELFMEDFGFDDDDDDDFDFDDDDDDFDDDDDDDDFDDDDFDDDFDDDDDDDDFDDDDFDDDDFDDDDFDDDDFDDDDFDTFDVFDDDEDDDEDDL